MTAIKRILCPVDFSDFSRRAFDQAVAVARIHGSEITLLHVSPVAMPTPPYEKGPSKLPEGARNNLLRCLADLAKTVGSRTVTVHCGVGEGLDVDAEIFRVADEMRADLIVIGTHGRSGFQHLVLGSVTEKVLRKASCPVLTVPSHAPDAVPPGPVLYRRILCGIDFSACSLAAFAYAKSLATGTGAHIDAVSVLHIVPLIDTSSAAALYYPGLTNEIQERLANRLESLALEARTTGADVEAITGEGSPYQEIIRLATERHADLIVLGASGHGAVDRLLFGSTINHVVRQAACPVLTVR